jgi:hypothetical protein
MEASGKRMYLATVCVKDLPKELENWRSINPRDPKTTSIVARRIAKTLYDEPEEFFFRNRGITILAEHASFDNVSGMLQVNLSNHDIHGLLDGGHTFAVIRDAYESLDRDTSTSNMLDRAYVRIEVLEGFMSKDEVTDIVDSRNTSAQVRDQSLANLRGAFDMIKEVIRNEPYADQVAYKETEFTEDGDRKSLDIKELLSYLICFDAEGFDDKNHPIIAYSGKASTLAYAIREQARLNKYIPLIPSILSLRDHIYKTMPGLYNEATGGRFGGLFGVEKKSAPVKLPFSTAKSEYIIPASFIYPVLASFRNLVVIDQFGKCQWKEDPEKFFDKIGAELIQRLGDQALALRNPTRLGKDRATWRTCFDYVAIEVMKAVPNHSSEVRVAVNPNDRSGSSSDRPETFMEKVGEMIQLLPNEFENADVYRFANLVLRDQYPNNNNLEAGVRRSLQGLCADGVIERVRDGRYRKKRRAVGNDILDTIVVPANKVGFDEVFIGQNVWHAIEIAEERIPHIRYIVAYQTSPVSNITHYAKVDSIVPIGNSGKYKVIFDGAARRIGEVNPNEIVSDRTSGFIRGRRYTSFEKVRKAKRLSEVF